MYMCFIIVRRVGWRMKSSFSGGVATQYMLANTSILSCPVCAPRSSWRQYVMKNKRRGGGVHCVVQRLMALRLLRGFDISRQG